MNQERAAEWHGAFTRPLHRLSCPMTSCPIWTVYRASARECRPAVCINILLVLFFFWQAILWDGEWLSLLCFISYLIDLLALFITLFFKDKCFSCCVRWCSGFLCVFADLMQRLRNRDRERERRSGGLRAASRRDRDRWLYLSLIYQIFMMYGLAK